ncbi:hypothetical protein TWF694_005552 [Orbilia ellipsospora]|uniref:DUF6923 domain-containing protein n=1 Tax=Orbilia ellipsospora TaxID=2528407 RepID=A0AAV9WZH0_9PEZI
MYGVEATTRKLVRINSNGVVTATTFTIPAGTGNIAMGEFDNNGQLYLRETTATWHQIDLKPGSPTYLQRVHNGAITGMSSWQFLDWVFYPNGGNYLWAFASSSLGGALSRVDLSTKAFSIVINWPSFTEPVSGAQFGASNGDLYWKGTDGEIFKANVLTGDYPLFLANGTATANTDGARCLYYDLVHPPIIPLPSSNTQPQPTTTITLAGTSSSVTTVFPTDTAGSTITDGSATATVVNYRVPVGIPTAASGPQFTCDKYAYVVFNDELDQMDVKTANLTVLKSNLSTSDKVNCVGFNVLDNYMYAADIQSGAVYRVAKNGTLTTITTLTAASLKNNGDIDDQGYYHLSQYGTSYVKIDLRPGSATYAQVVKTGTLNPDGFEVGDWTYIPATGEIWSFGWSTNDNHGMLVKLNLTTLQWTVVAEYRRFIIVINVALVFAHNSGDMYFNDSGSGKIYHINIFRPSTPTFVVQGPTTGNADGCRCPFSFENF